MKTIRIVLTWLLLGSLTGTLLGAERVNVRALLVVASNEKGAVDRRLADYEPTLKRLLRFESFRLAGEGAATLGEDGASVIALGRGQRLELSSEGGAGRGLRVKVRWLADGVRVMDTGLSLRPGVPAVLGGPGTGRAGEVFAVLLVAQ